MRTAAIAFALLLPVTAVAQQPASETIEVRVTNIDVVVTDRAGNPVTGLTADDFEVVESGKPQAITNFSEVRDTAAGDASGGAATEATVAPAPRRRILVFVDSSSIHPHARTQMLDTFERSLDTLMRDGDQAALVLFNGVSAETLTGLTSDRATLLARLREAAKKSGGTFAMESQKNSIVENAQSLLSRAAPQPTSSGPPGSGPGQPQAPGGGGSGAGSGSGITAPQMLMTIEEAYSKAISPAHSYAEQLFRTQRALVAYLRQTLEIVAGAEGKKVLLFIGADLSDNPGSDLYEQIDAVFAQHRATVQRSSHHTPSRSLGGELRALAQQATRVGVTMYMVDAAQRGGGADASQLTTEFSGSSGHNLDSASAMASVASLTGGIYGTGGKAFQHVLNTIARDFNAYYSIGYRSDSRGAGNIEVRVKRPGVRVRTRRFHEGAPAPAAIAATTPQASPAPTSAAVPAPQVEPALPVVADDSLEGRLRSNLFDDAHSDFPVSVTASAPRPHESGRFQVDLSINFPSTVKMVEEGMSLKGRVAILLITANEEGRTSKASTQVQELTFPRGTRAKLEAQKTLTYTFPMIIGAGKVTVSVAVADQLAGTSGFARTIITTP